MIRKILVANRGDVACRIIRAAQKLGIQTVAVYSSSDQDLEHAYLADEAYELDENSNENNYMRGPKILALARKTKSDSIHPGYGFLSQNYGFAKSCEESGIRLVGTTARTLKKLQYIDQKKILMHKSGLPVIPGFQSTDQSTANFKKQAVALGFPLLVKSLNGGGSRCVKLVKSANDFDEVFAQCRQESEDLFDDPNVLIEKYYSDFKFIDVPIYRDMHGEISTFPPIYPLFKKSSARHKDQLFSETPDESLSEDESILLSEHAKKAALAIGLKGNASVRFLIDIKQTGSNLDKKPFRLQQKPDLKFYFYDIQIGLNPDFLLTQMVMTEDLIEWQMRISSGEPLPLEQQFLRSNGHALCLPISFKVPKSMIAKLEPIDLNFHKRRSWPDHILFDFDCNKTFKIVPKNRFLIGHIYIWGENRDRCLRNTLSALSTLEFEPDDTNIKHLINELQKQNPRLR